MRRFILPFFLLPLVGNAQAVNAGAGVAVSRGGTLSAGVTVPAMPRQAVITGQPYSCEQVSEHKQTLADGTNISDRRMVVKMYRDSAGRTRTERPMMMGPLASADAPMMTEISDTVADYRYILDITKHVAHRSAYSAVPTPLPSPPPPPPGTAMSQAMIRTPAGVVTSGSAGVIGAFQPARPEIESESLGTKVIDGTPAEGRRTTMTYAIGSLGNDRPIVVTHENWTSPELRIMLLSVNHDPRSGDSTTRVENLSRAEPDSTLFQVPADYEMVDDNGPVTLQFSSAAPAVK